MRRRMQKQPPSISCRTFELFRERWLYKMERYKDTSLSASERAEDLLDRMTIEQKIAQLQCTMTGGNDPANDLKPFVHGIGEVLAQPDADAPDRVAAFNRKVVDAVMGNPPGIPPIIHNEAVTGLSAPGATIFPSAIGLGATFSADTVQTMADIIRRQMLAVGYRHALSPVMDVARDPRWGRVGETYGEDPALCAAMSVAFTRGLQSDDLKNGAVATGKHFLGYSFSDGGLNLATNPIPSRELREVYAKPFQASITSAGLQAIMNSYGTLDNEMVIGSKHILTDLLRDEMGFKGVTVSDYRSINRLVNHRVSPDMASAGVAALKAGMDIECPVPKCYTEKLAEAVSAGLLSADHIDMAVFRVLETKFKLGLFENPYALSEAIPEVYTNPRFRAHSLKAARESVVLLKNDGILPLSKGYRKIAVIGPHGDSIRLLYGGYTPAAGLELALGGSLAEMAGMLDMDVPQTGADFVKSEPMTGCEVLREHESVTAALREMYGCETPTVLASIKAKCPEAQVGYAVGCEPAGSDRSSFSEAVRLAADSDVAILTLGGKCGWGRNCTIGEGVDCDDIGLPGIQEELAREICGTGTPVIVVHMDSRPLSSAFIAENASAVIEYWFPGTTGGEALADVLFGDYNPAGRLPMTAARNAGQIPVYAGQKTGNSYHGSAINGSRYCEGSVDPLFHFGAGLSYTRFEYTGLKVSPRVASGDVVEVSVDVKNTGDVDGEEVIQLYVSDELASMIRPYKELAGFSRTAIKAGETVTVCFTFRADQFAFLDEKMQWLVEAGDMTVHVGASSEDIRLTGRFHISDTAVIEGRKRGFYAHAETMIVRKQAD